MFRYLRAILVPKVGMCEAIVTGRTSLRRLPDYVAGDTARSLYCTVTIPDTSGFCTVFVPSHALENHRPPDGFCTAIDPVCGEVVPDGENTNCRIAPVSTATGNAGFVVSVTLALAPNDTIMPPVVGSFASVNPEIELLIME